MRPPKENALRQEGVNNTFTKRKYNLNIFTQFLHRVKQNLRRAIRSFFLNDAIGATPLHSQNICDPDGRQLQVTRIDALVSIVDAKGNMVRFSGYLVPELREALLAVEKNTQGRAIR